MASWASAFTSALPGIGSTIGSFILADKQAKSERMWQEYNNKMTQLQNAFNQNAITTNQVQAVQASAARQFLIEKEEQKTLASVELQAAATGTTGRSVDRALHSVRYNAEQAEAARKQDLENQIAYFTNQRQSSELQTALALDRSTIPSPSPTTLMLGLGTAALGAYNRG